MSQEEVYDFLKAQKGREFTVQQVALELGINDTSAAGNLKRLLKRKAVKRTQRRLFALPRIYWSVKW